MADEETKVVTTEEETTEPIDPASLLMGYRVGQMIRGMRIKKEPVAYLYNGVRLPKLPEDGVYAVIIPRTAVTVTGKKDAYHLYTATAPLYAQLMHYNGEITGRIIKVKEVHTQKHYECYAGETEWKLVYTSVDDIAGGYLDWDTDDQPTLWANTDIYYSDKTVDNSGEYAGKLYIGASEPVPVYE